MKILNVITHLDPVTCGGTGERTIQMCRHLVKSGHECTILTTDCGMTEAQRMALQGLELVEMRCVVKRLFLPMLSIGRVRNLIKGADIVHLMGYWSILNAIVYVYARLLRKPYVICPAGMLNIYGRSKIMKKTFNAIIGKRIMRDAAGHIAISKDEFEHFVRLDVERSAVTVIPNGINTAHFIDSDAASFRAHYGIGPNPYILYMGRLNYYKGPDLLLQAYHRVLDKLPNYKLVFAGPDEDMLEWIQRYVADNNLSGKVHFLGHVSGALKSQAYHGCELVVIPSRWDAMSIVVLEAGAAAKPVVITNKCGFDEILDVEGGLVVDASIEGIADGLMSYIGNKDAFKIMGKNLHTMATVQYSWDRIIQRITSLYDEILRRTEWSIS